MRTLLAMCILLVLLAPARLYAQPKTIDRPIHGLGHVHMDVPCSPAVSTSFDRALALLHNFWYARALQAFTEVAQRDAQCAMAYWGAAMTYNHPFWDAPTKAAEAAAWTLVQKGLGQIRNIGLALREAGQHRPSRRVRQCRKRPAQPVLRHITPIG